MFFRPADESRAVGGPELAGWDSRTGGKLPCFDTLPCSFHSRWVAASSGNFADDRVFRIATPTKPSAAVKSAESKQPRGRACAGPAPTKLVLSRAPETPDQARSSTIAERCLAPPRTRARTIRVCRAAAEVVTPRHERLAMRALRTAGRPRRSGGRAMRQTRRRAQPGSLSLTEGTVAIRDSPKIRRRRETEYPHPYPVSDLPIRRTPVAPVNT